jgi:hypothetical protein
VDAVRSNWYGCPSLMDALEGMEDSVGPLFRTGSMLPLRLTVPLPPRLERVMLNLPSIPGFTHSRVGVDDMVKSVLWALTMGKAVRINSRATEAVEAEIMVRLLIKRVGSIKVFLVCAWRVCLT